MGKSQSERVRGIKWSEAVGPGRWSEGELKRQGQGESGSGIEGNGPCEAGRGSTGNGQRPGGGLAGEGQKERAKGRRSEVEGQREKGKWSEGEWQGEGQSPWVKDVRKNVERKWSNAIRERDKGKGTWSQAVGERVSGGVRKIG